MNSKPNLPKTASEQNLKVSFPEKQVVFLDVVVRRFCQRSIPPRNSHARLDPPVH